MLFYFYFESSNVMCLDTVVVATACIWVLMDGIRMVTYEFILVRYFILNSGSNIIKYNKSVIINIL